MEIAAILALINTSVTIVTAMVNDSRQKTSDQETAALQAAITRANQADADFDAAFTPAPNSDRPPI